MAAAIEKATGVSPKLIEGRAGVFTVISDGKTIFSKHDEGRFPEESEVLGSLEAT